MGNPRGMRRDFEALEKRRMAAVRLFPTDLNNSEIGRRLKICDQTVSRWRAQYRAGGESALRRARRAGRKPLLSTADQKRLVECSKKAPSDWAMRHPCARQRSLRPSQLKPRVLTVRLRLSTGPLGQAVPTRRVELPTRQAKSSDCCLLSERRASRKRGEFRQRRLQHTGIGSSAVHMLASGGCRLSPDAVCIPVLHP